MPARPQTPMPVPFALPDRVGVEDNKVHDALRMLERGLNSVTRYLRTTITPSGVPVPDGPWLPTVAPVGSTFVVDFQADQSGPNITCYRIYRAIAGTRSSPSTPGPGSATCIGTMNPNQVEDGGHYLFHDRNITIAQLDPANPTRFSYWVVSVDDRNNQSIYVLATGSPIETLTNGPGDQSPELKMVPLNKLFLTDPAAVDAANWAIPQPLAITSSTNATPIVITLGAGHGILVDDLVCVDQHATNTNANGWWRVSASGATTITLKSPVTGANSVGNGVGGATGSIYPLSLRVARVPPVSRRVGNTSAAYPDGDFVNPVLPSSVQPLYATYVPWYSEQAGVALVQAGTGNMIFLPNPAAGASTFVSQEIPLSKFANLMHLSMSAYVYIAAAGSPSSFTFRMECLREDGFSFFVNDWDLVNVVPNNSAISRLVFNFALPNIFNLFTSRRLKFRFGTVVAGGGTAGTSTVYMFNPMLSTGDIIPAYTAAIDPTDYWRLNIAGDTTVSSWGRPIAQLIVRDASAPYN
jgi:hypothetical protein